MDLSDDEFDKYLKEMQKEIDSYKYTDIGVVLHVFTILLATCDKGLLSVDRSEIVDQSKLYIDWLRKNGCLDISMDLSDIEFGYAGLSFHEVKTKEFEEIVQYFGQQAQAAEKDSFHKKAQALLGELKSDPELFIKRLNGASVNEPRYHRKPILKYISASDFISALLEMPPSKTRAVGDLFRKRYISVDAETNGQLLEEKDWLLDLKKELLAYSRLKPRKLSSWVFENMANHAVTEAINTIEDKTAESSDQSS